MYDIFLKTKKIDLIADYTMHCSKFRRIRKIEKNHSI